MTAPINAFDILALARRLAETDRLLGRSTDDSALWSRRLNDNKDAYDAVVEAVNQYEREQKSGAEVLWDMQLNHAYAEGRADQIEAMQKQEEQS